MTCARLRSLLVPVLMLAASCRGSSVGHAAVIAALEAEVKPSFVVAGHEPPPVTLAERMARLDVPGLSVAVWMDDEIAWVRGFGVADVASGLVVDDHTLFQAASISKPVAATGALDLVEEGRLDLDADVNTSLAKWRVPDSEFTTMKKVTLRRLLSHTAGTTVGGFPGYERGAAMPDAAGVLRGAGNTAPVAVFREPGAAYQYSGGGFTIVQQMLADVTGREFAGLMRDRVLVPAGMSESTYQQPLPEARWREAAVGYREGGSEVEGEWHVYPEQAAAGLWTTPSDLARWAMMIQRAYAGSPTEVLSPETAGAMLTGVAEHYGLGVGLSDDGLLFGHGGSNEGFRCRLQAYVDGRGGIVVMTNSDAGDRLIGPVMRTIAEAYGWPGFDPARRTPVRLSPEALEAVAGQFDVVALGRITFAPSDGGIEASGDRLDHPMRFYPDSVLRFFSADDGAPLVFERENGRVVRLVFAGRLTGRRVE